jgi:hypothetical protein
VSSSPIFRSPWAVAFLATVIMGLLMALVDLALPHGGDFWRDWVTEHSTIVYFCEPASVMAFFRQKVDVYTNLGFFFVGALLLAYARSDRDSSVGGFAVVHAAWSRWFGLALWMTFAGSSLFHASLTRSGEALDLAGTYATALLPGFFNLHRLWSLGLRRRLPPWPFVTAWLLIWLTASLLIFRVSSRVVVPSGLLLIGITGFLLFLKVHPRRGWWFAGSSVVLTVLAASFFVMDIRRVGCDPGGWYQAHGVWHLLAAGAAGTYYGFMRRLQ